MRLVPALACAAALLAVTAPAASAHVVPTSTLQLDVRDGDVDAALAIPLTDVEAAVGIDLGDGAAVAEAVGGRAIALGHALGSSGTRLLGTLLATLEATGGRYWLQTMCEGGGMANATIIERLD